MSMMPIDDSVKLQRQQHRTAWQDYWSARNPGYEAPSARSAPAPAGKPKDDKEKARLKREAASGWYTESTAPFNPIVVAGQGEHGLAKDTPKTTQIERKRGTVADTYKMLWNLSLERPEGAHETNDAAPETVQGATPAQAEEAAQPAVAQKATETVTKPRLEKPEQTQSELDNLIDEMEELLKCINKAEEEHRDLGPEADAKLYRLLISTILTQRSAREESCQATQEKLLKHQEIKRNIYQKMCELRDKQIEADKSAGISGWVGVGLTIGIVALFVASVVVTIATGGMASPAIGASLTIAQGTLGVAQGVNTAVGGYYNHRSQTHERDLYGERALRDEHHTLIKTEVSKHKDANEWVFRHISLLRQILKGRLANTRYTN